jgi:serine/threonine protein kinase
MSTENSTPLHHRDPYLGMTLNGRYIIEKELGRGGIGVVYFARDRQLLSKPVVIKVLLDSSVQDAWLKKKFNQEIEALARIDHPGIVGVLDIGQMPDGKPYFVMQFVEGVTLRSLIKPGGMELGRVARIVRQISQALTAAHDKRVYHRDLKPENIMLQSLGGGDEQVKIIDFGVARVENSELATNTTEQVVVGTFSYMSPEQLMSKPVSASSDTFSLGVIVYEMVTGRRPFEPASMFQLPEAQRAGVKIKPIDFRSELPPAAQAVILKALSFEPEDRYQRARELGEELASAIAELPAVAGRRTDTKIIQKPAAPPDIQKAAPEKQGSPVKEEKAQASPGIRMVILYKRNSQPDEQLLQVLETEFASRGHQVFVDRHLGIGVEWAKEIERQIKAADAVIPLLSAASASSEMFGYEVEIAHDAARRQSGKPRLLPVRVGYEEPLPESLAGILAPLQQALWNGPQDSPRLFEDLLGSMQTFLTPKAEANLTRKLEPVGGAVPLNSEFYIVRTADEEFRSAIDRRDSIVLVKGARQIGKTSLLARGLQQARMGGAKIILTDFQLLSAPDLETAETLLLTLSNLIAEQLDLDVFPREIWKPDISATVNFERYVRREVLKKMAVPVVWGMDEVDKLFTCNYGSEIFGMFRSWHNARSLDPDAPWQKLTLAIAYATEAHLFITDLNQSPFNIGTRLLLEDFSFEQVAEVNRRYGSPLRDKAEIARYFRLVGGNPYLVRRGLHEMVTRNIDITALEAQAVRDEGPFGDHLRRMLVMLAQDTSLCEVVRGILQGRPCQDAESFFRLRSAGVMSGETARDIRPRCQLYATYLERHLL